VNGFIAWCASNRVVATLFWVVVFAGGFLSLSTLRVELFPEITPRLITVSVPYPGASPEEVEQAVCVRVEEAIHEVQGIRTITSRAYEGHGVVLAELESGASVPDVLDRIKSQVGAITTFPVQTEEPVVRDVPLELHVASVALAGRVPEDVLKRFAERVRDELEELPGVTRVRLAGARPYEVSIEVSEASLRRHGLTLDEVAGAVRRSSLDLPGGLLKTPSGEILVRAKGQAGGAAEFEAIPVVARPDGTRLPLGEVARVRDGFEDVDLHARFDGEPALLLQVFRGGEQSALAVADAVKAYVERAAREAPEGLTVALWEDWSKILRDRIDLLRRNGIQGLVLVFLTLALFLRPRFAFWVTWGIFVSVLGTFWLMPLFGVSINLLSLFGFILVTGILVDDGIVVGENVYRLRREGVPPLEASVRGAREIFVPVLLAVATNIFAFIPMLNLPGTNGDFAYPIPVVVILCLVFSLLEGFISLPAHLSGLRDVAIPEGWRGWIPRAQDAVARGLERFVERVYRPALERVARHRYVTLAAGGAALLVVAGLAAGGRVKFDFFPPIDADYVVAGVTLPEGTPAEVTARAVEDLERAAARLREELERERGRSVFRHVLSVVGVQPMRMAQDPSWGADPAAFSGSHVGEVNLQLVPAEERGEITAADLAARWRRIAGDIPDVELSFITSAAHSGKPIFVELRAKDLGMLAAAAEKLEERLARYPGVYEVADSHQAGKREVQVAITPSGEALGLTQADLARQVRQAFYGEEVQRIQRGRDDVRVMVRYPPEERRSLGNLTELRVRLPGGVEAPLPEVAEVVHAAGPAVIQRRDRRRVVTVTADVDRAAANPNEIVRELERAVLPELAAEFPGLSFSMEGEQRDQREMVDALLRGMVVVLLLIYAALAVNFRSYLQPSLIMLSIPFGVAGAVLAHFALGMSLTLLSMIGMMALVGVVVNDAIVMIEFINDARRKGAPPRQAILQAGPLRFRPILLTSLTTFVGLVPIMSERSLQAQFLIPMAVSLAYGVLLATAVTLFVVPAAYLVVEDVRRPFGGGEGRGA
jgi:multidrug efflux pump subunit AcrB